MKVIARGGLRDLVEERVGIMKHYRSHRSASRQFLLQQRRLHSQAYTGNLDINARGRPVVAEQERQTHQPLVADRSDLGGLAVRHGVHQGADASLDEIDESDGLIGTVERLPVFQRSMVKMRAKPFVVTGR